MPKTDLTIRITFDVENPGNTIIKTNLKTGAVKEILENWIFDKVGTGKDKNAPDTSISIYEIEILLDLEEDVFFTKSNTGNRGLTLGIVMSVLSRLDTLKILPLS